MTFYVKPPNIREAAVELLRSRDGPVELGEICDFVMKRVKLTGRTPRNSVVSVLNRTPGVRRVGRAKYTIG